MSPDGTWVALSRVIGDDVVVSARRADAGAPSEVLGSIPYADLKNRPPRVSVATDGSHVLWAGNIFAPLPDSPTSPVFRWVRATGVVETVAPPAVASPPPGVPYPTNLRFLSSDGARAIWSQAFYQGGSDFRFMRSVTDTGTDAVIAQYESETSSSNRFSTGGRSETTTWIGTSEHRVVDVDTNTSTSLTPALAAAQAAFPGGGFRPEISSDDGRFTVLQRPFETPATYVLWDNSTQEISLVAQGPGIRIDTVDDSGTVVYSIDTGATIRSVHRSTDGTELIAADAPMQPSWPDDPPVRPLTSADRRTSVFSEPVPVLGNQLIARRCR